MREFNKSVEITSYGIGSVKEKDLNKKIYQKMLEDLKETLKPDKDFKFELLDLFAEDSYVLDNKQDWFNYTGISEQQSYDRNGEEIIPDLVCSPNNIPIKDAKFGICTIVGSKFGYGMYHGSLPEAFRLMTDSSILVASLSKYWYFKEINQLLTSYLYDYIKAIEIVYSIQESKISSSKFFCYYRKR